MLTERSSPEPLAARLLLVLGAQSAFAIITQTMVGTPPAFLTTVAFGAFLALGLESQAARRVSGKA
jgi:hypothetical protein